VSLFPLVSFDKIDLGEANALLARWGHRMGPMERPDYADVPLHALMHDGEPVALAMAAPLVREHVGGGLGHLNRSNAIELARLCAARPGLCRVALRLWREFVLPQLAPVAISYQDADLHNGNTYRFDGWARAGFSSSGTDQRTGRKGRRKWIWVYPPAAARQEQAA
jgi:antitoxin VapB